MVRSLVEKIAEKLIKLEYSPQLLSDLVELGYNNLYGARELRRMVTDKVEDLIAQLIIEKRIKSGDTMVMYSLDKFEIQ